MGNITGALIENAFQPHTGAPAPLDVQEEIKKFARDSCNRELYRLLHAEMEHGTLERSNISHSNADGDCGGSGGTERPGTTARRTSGEDTASAQSSFSMSGGRCGGHQAAEHTTPSTESVGRKVDGKSGSVGAGFDPTEAGRGTNQKPVLDPEESRDAPRMAFKKKILSNYRTEVEDVTTKAETLGASSAESDARKSDAVYSDSDAKVGSLEAKVVSSAAGASKPNTKILNINNCIEVIVMSELQKLDSVPDEPSGKRMPLFGLLEMESCKSRASETVKSDLAKDRGSAESSWPVRADPSGRAVDVEPKREKWPQYGHLDVGGSRTGSEVSPHRPGTRKPEVVPLSGPGRNAPSNYRTVPFYPEATVSQDLPRIYPPSGSESSARGARQMLNQANEVALPHAPMAKYSPAGAWGHGHDVSLAQSSSQILSTDSGYRVTPSNQMSLQMVDQHRRKVDKDPEPIKYPWAEYPSMQFSGPSQYPVISGLTAPHVAYQTNSPALLDKHHNPEPASYMFPAKVPRERAPSQFELPFANNQPDSLQPPVPSYLKHSPKNSPVIAYEKDMARPAVADTQYIPADLLKVVPGGISTGSPRGYRMVTEPQPQVTYRSERQIPPEKRNFGFQNMSEEFDPERRVKRMVPNSRETGSSCMGSDHPIPRTYSASYAHRGREGVERSQSGMAEETPLDLTVKKDLTDPHQSSVYFFPSGGKQQQQQQQHQMEWEMGGNAGYRPSYIGDEEQLQGRVLRPSLPKGPDFAVPEMQRREVLDARYLYEKVPQGMQVLPPESNVGRMIPTPVQERNTRTSVIASHPFDDSPASVAMSSHLTIQHMSEAMMKIPMHSMGAWKQTAYSEMVPRSRSHTLDSESASRMNADAGRHERSRARASNSSSELSHLATTSPTIPHLSPVQPLATPAGSQSSGSRRGPGPSLLGSHSPSDILHLQCKVCGSTYGSLRSFRMHFAKVHGLEPLPEHCNISTISGTKNAMSKVVAIEDGEPPSLQRETMPSDVAGLDKTRSFSYEQFPNGSRSMKPDTLRVEVPPGNTRTKQIAEVYPMPARVSRGLSPQLKLESSLNSGRRLDLTDVQTEPNDGPTKPGGDAKNSSCIVNCDLGIFRSRNCYSDLGCDRDTDCPECLDGFKDISDWKMHISTHMMRSCTCKVCNLSFTHSGALKKHIHATHLHLEKVDVEYRCLFCREAFSDEKVLFFHTQEHEKRYSRMDNARRDSTSSQGYKQPNRSSDSESIQMAVPDTTSSDDVRPTSGFGDGSCNVSPNAESKGSGFERTSFSDLTSTQSGSDSGRKPEEAKNGGDERKLKTRELEQDCKLQTLFHQLEGSGSDSVQGYEQNKLDVRSFSKSPGSLHGVKTEGCEPQSVDKKVKGEKAKVSEEPNTCVSKKQALLKRFKSTEEKDSMETESSQLVGVQPSPMVAIGAGAPVTRSGGSSSSENSDAFQPMHLRDLFSMMGQEVETSICGFRDIGKQNSYVPTRRSRCVRDVCDEIIAQSFRDDNSSREASQTGSTRDPGLELNLKSKMKEQLKNLVSVEQESALEVPVTRTGVEAMYRPVVGSWVRSPCSSRDSCHSLEIDESEFDKEPSVEGHTDGSNQETKESDKRPSYVSLTPLSNSPRYESDKKEPIKSRDGSSFQADGDARSLVGNRSFLGRNEDVGLKGEYFFARQASPEDISSAVVAVTASATSKESCSPSSTQKLEVSMESDNSVLGGNPILRSTEPVPVPGGQKRKCPSSDSSLSSKDGNDVDEPLAKRTAP